MKKPDYIDTHAHMNFAIYDLDRDDVLARLRDTNTWVINVGTQQDTSRLAVELAEQHVGLFAIVGLHPIHADVSHHDAQELGEEGKGFTSRGEVFDVDFYRALAQSSQKVVGIGECGLDYYRKESASLEKQLTAFHAQIALALELDLPLMLHIRPSAGTYDAYHDVLEILKPYKEKHGEKLRGNAHFFAGDTAIAEQFIAIGFTISFTGVITFAPEYAEVIKNIPLQHIMSETDCPYVTPVPHRGTRNEPVYVSEVVKKIAEIKEMELEEVQKILFENTQRMYRL